MKFNSHQQKNNFNRDQQEAHHLTQLNTIDYNNTNYSQKTPTKITSGLAAFANREEKDSKKLIQTDGNNIAYRIEEKNDGSSSRGASGLLNIDQHDKLTFIQTNQILSIMTSVVSKFDSRIRLIEENQNKIAGSLSRFLDKMNSLLFKGNIYSGIIFKIQKIMLIARKAIMIWIKQLYKKISFPISQKS